MNSDGNGVFNNSAASDNFAHQHSISNVGSSTATGPWMSGEPGSCGFGNSTYYKFPDQPAGTGLGQGDIFWIDSQVVTPGCYFLRGWPANPWGGFSMQIYGDVSTCGGGPPVGVMFCFGDPVAAPCPCGNYGGPLEGCAHSMGTVGGKL